MNVSNTLSQGYQQGSNIARASVLARILKMPVQNSIHKILISTLFKSLFCHKGQFKLQSFPRK